MKQLIYLALIPAMETVSIADIELVVKICCHTILTGVAVLTYFHKSKTK